MNLISAEAAPAAAIHRTFASKIIYAIEDADVDELRSAVAAGADVNATLSVAHYKGLTPLMLAAQRGDVAMCRALLDMGADPHKTARPPFGITALANAAYSGRVNACKLLLATNPPAAHIRKAIDQARAGQNHGGQRMESDYHEVLNMLLWARDGVTLPSGVVRTLMGNHPENDDAAPAAANVRAFRP